MNYFKLIKNAYQLTISHPVLWLFGLFFAGFASLGLLPYVNFRSFSVESPTYYPFLNSGVNALVIIILLAILWLGFNLARVILILYLSDLLSIERIRQSEKSKGSSFKLLFLESRKYLLPVSLVNLGVFAATLASYFFLRNFWNFSPYLGSTWILSITVYVFLAAFFTLADIFSSFFIVLYQRSVFSAVNLSLELVIKRWKVVIKGAVIFLALFLGFLFVSRVFAGVFKFIFLRVFSSLIIFRFIPFAGYQVSIAILSAIIIWLLAALVNIFFKVCFLLFFAQIVKPPFHSVEKEAKPDLTAIPAHSN